MSKKNDFSVMKQAIGEYLTEKERNMLKKKDGLTGLLGFDYSIFGREAENVRRFARHFGLEEREEPVFVVPGQRIEHRTSSTRDTWEWVTVAEWGRQTTQWKGDWVRFTYGSDACGNGHAPEFFRAGGKPVVGLDWSKCPKDELEGAKCRG